MNHPYNPDVHRRKSIRLRDYDYAQDGAYFVTLVTHRRSLLFGEVIEGTMRLNRAGHLIANTWQWLSNRYPFVSLDSYIVMPNHLHGIIVIADQPSGGSRTAPTPRKPLGWLVGAFKTVTTRQFNATESTPGQPLWQRNFYERVIRNADELDRVGEYIVANPLL